MELLSCFYTIVGIKLVIITNNQTRIDNNTTELNNTT